jgi:hypothetical protein
MEGKMGAKTFTDQFSVAPFSVFRFFLPWCRGRRLHRMVKILHGLFPVVISAITVAFFAAGLGV